MLEKLNKFTEEYLFLFYLEISSFPAFSVPLKSKNRRKTRIEAVPTMDAFNIKYDKYRVKFA